MKEIQVKTYYPDNLNGGYFAISPFANLIDNETVILYAKTEENAIVAFQSDNNDIKYFYMERRDFLRVLRDNRVPELLDKLDIPTNYTVVKARPSCSNIFVSEASNVGIDISLMGEGKDAIWDVEGDIYPKVTSKKFIELNGKEE